MTDIAPDQESDERSGLSSIQIAAGAVAVVIVVFIVLLATRVVQRNDGAVAVVIVVFIVLLATRDVQRNEASAEPVGSFAPPVAGVSYDGQVFDLDDVLTENRNRARVDGEWVVVNFFASWCIPCRQEHPDLILFDTEGASCPTTLVGVTFNDREENVADFFDELGGGWPVLVGDTSSIVIDYSVLTAPETVVIDPAGLVTQKFIGAVTYDQLVEEIRC